MPEVKLEELLPAVDRTPADYKRAAEDVRLDLEGLHALAGSPYPFVRIAVAQQERAAPQTLARVLDGEFSLWDRNHVLRVVAGHPRADRVVLLRVLREVVSLLSHPVSRPYAAVLALSERGEIEPDELRFLVTLRGTSRRMRRALVANLDAREGPMAQRR